MGENFIDALAFAQRMIMITLNNWMNLKIQYTPHCTSYKLLKGWLLKKLDSISVQVKVMIAILVIDIALMLFTV